MDKEEILIKHGCAFVRGTTPKHFMDAMDEFASVKVKSSLEAAIPKGSIVVTKEQLSKYHSWVLEYNEVNRESAEVMNGYILLNWITQNKCPIVF